MIKKILILAFAVVVAFSTIVCAGGVNDMNYVKISTSVGDMFFVIDGKSTPKTAANFLTYVDEGFYNGTIFHRVIDGFMVQGGGFDEQGAKKETNPPVMNEAASGMQNDYGTIAMARTGDPHSATSQFFINVADNANLNYPNPDGHGYCAFGDIIAGEKTLHKIKSVKVMRGQLSPHQPIAPVVINSIIRVKKDDAGIEELKKEDEAFLAEENKRKDALAVVEREIFEKALSFAKEVESKSVSEGKITSSGLGFLSIASGTGSSPTDSSVVDVHYTGWLMDGTKFDSSRDRGQSIQFPLNGVIPGWTEGVSMMKEGGKAILVIPYPLAYGESGTGPIPPKATLIFEVELIKILQQ